MKKYILKFIKNPIKFSAYVIKKILFDPVKYRVKNGYDAEKYWSDRFFKYGFESYISTGNEGISKKDNLLEYNKQIPIFKNLINKYVPNIKNRKCLEIGTGNGFYTSIMNDFDVSKYTGSDITKVFFSKLLKKFPKYNFIQLDITKKKLEEKYDLIIMIDVIEHIVDKDKLSEAMKNISNMLNKNGILIISGFYIIKNNHKEFFYEMKWTYGDIDKNLPKLTKVCNPKPYRNDNIVFYKRLIK